MNILLINHYAGAPRYGMEFRPYYFAREWVRLGHTVTIAAATFSHLRIENPRPTEAATPEEIDGIRYIWFSTPMYRGNGAGRVANISAFLLQISRRARELADSANGGAVIASSTYPLDMVVARSIARRAGAMLVFELHDLWPMSPVQLGGMSPRHPFIKIMQWGEGFAYRNADAVISLLANAEPYMISRGLKSGRFHYIPNGIEPAEWQTDVARLPFEHESMLSTLRSQDRFIVGYAGSHGVANALEPIIRASEYLKGLPISFVLVGQGPEKSKLQALAKSLHADNVKFLSSVPKDAIPRLLSAMDALAISWQAKPIYRFGICPNKLMDYMMAGRPIIHAIDNPNDLVTMVGCGFSVAPENPLAIANAVKRMMELPRDEREEMGMRGKQYVTQNNQNSFLAKKCIEVLQT